MEDHYKSFIKNVHGMSTSLNGIISGALNPEVRAAMSPDQKQAVEMGKNAFDLTGSTLEEKSNNLTKNMSHVFSIIK